MYNELSQYEAFAGLVLKIASMTFKSILRWKICQRLEDFDNLGIAYSGNELWLDRIFLDLKIDHKKTIATFFLQNMPQLKPISVF